LTLDNRPTPTPRLAWSLARWLVVGLAIALPIAATPLGCGFLGPAKPDQQKQVILSTEFDDERLGEEVSKQLAAEMGIVDDPALNEYVRSVAARLLPYAPKRHFDYSFHVVDQSAPNAFALPGGHVYVSRGLLQLVNSEDELACVIGHEITHAAERHTASRQEFERRLNPLSMGWMRAGHVAGYGREQERSADHGGQTIAAKAGYDPMGMATFLRDLDAMDRLNLGWSRLPNFLASHPTTPERAAAATHFAETIEWTRKPGVASSQEDFLRKFQGLVIGPNPAEGIFRDTRFLHPDLDFTIRFPDGWTLVNTQRAVGAIAPGGKAMVALSLAGEGDDAVAAAHRVREDELEPGGARIIRGEPVKLGSVDGYRLEAEGTINGMRSAGNITFIAHQGLVFRIDALSGMRSASRYTGRGSSVVRSFRPLTDEERDSFEVMRLLIVRAIGGEDLAALSQRTGNSLTIGNTGILNDIHFGDALEDGRLVKIGAMEHYEVREREPVRSDVKAEDDK